MDEGKILKVVLVNLSQRDSIDMLPVYVDQKGAEGKTMIRCDNSICCAVKYDVPSDFCSIFDNNAIS